MRKKWSLGAALSHIAAFFKSWCVFILLIGNRVTIFPAEGRFSDTGTVSPVVKMLVMQMTPKSHQKSNFGAHFRQSAGPDKIFWVHSIPCHLKKVCNIMFGGGYASPPLAQTAKVNVDFSEIDQFGSDRSTGDFCLRDTGEGAFGRLPPRANLVSIKFCFPNWLWSLVQPMPAESPSRDQASEKKPIEIDLTAGGPDEIDVEHQILDDSVFFVFGETKTYLVPPKNSRPSGTILTKFGDLRPKLLWKPCF